MGCPVERILGLWVSFLDFVRFKRDLPKQIALLTTFFYVSTESALDFYFVRNVTFIGLTARIDLLLVAG